ncbi:MAG TPA: M28 family peptidase [Usitatibacteraceae bacterium]
MRKNILLASSLAVALSAPAFAQTEPAKVDPVKTMVGRLELAKYKATIKGLTQFGDRRQGTDRNRAAVDWIEAQLKSYGCTNTERIKYVFEQPARNYRAPAPLSPVIASGEIRKNVGDSRMRGNVGPVSVNEDAEKQTDPVLRKLNSQPATNGPREEVFCTKVGSTHPEEMYIVGAHMDGHGWGEAADDDGSGTALVMELARVFSSPDVITDRSIRFVLWNNEETGLNGAKAYVEQRFALQGKESPVGSGKYPEPKWLGMIQHDMMMWDHGMPRADGSVNPEQRPEADVNIEFRMDTKFGEQAAKLAYVFRDANEKYATDYPAAVGHHMTNTDSDPFKDLVPAISLRENERGMQIGAGWNPNYHQATDLFSSYSDKDFLLGLNAAQTTLGAVAGLAGAKVKK